MDLTSNPNPQNLSEARFSLPLCMGTVLARGDLTFADMNPSILEDKEIRRQSAKVSMVYDPEIDSLFPKTRPCLVIVEDIHGNEYSCKNLYRRGDPEKPMTLSDVQRKFNSLTQNSLSETTREKILEWALSLEGAHSVPLCVFEGDIQ